MLARIGLTLVGIGSLAMSTSLPAADYRFTRIDFPGSIQTTARGVNARGDIVGGYADAAEVTRGFLLRKGGGYASIEFPGSVLTAAFGINARGDITGHFIAGDAEHAFLLRDGEFTQIDFPDAVGTFGFGINNAGDVVGRRVNAAGAERGFILRNGVFAGVNVPGSSFNQLFGVQDNGKVVSGVTITASDGSLHGFVKFGPGHIEYLDFPGQEVPCTVGRKINQRGDVVGEFAATAEECDAGIWHGYVMRDGRYTQIDVPNATSTRALSINDDGVVVGDFVDPRGVVRGFRAVPQP
jgi:uncharacterized membrane protein